LPEQQGLKPLADAVDLRENSQPIGGLAVFGFMGEPSQSLRTRGGFVAERASQRTAAIARVNNVMG